MLLLDRLQEIIILHRKLDYDDEDATLDEQAEKILYFYSTTLSSLDLKEQLSIATLAEALIALTDKFSKDPIQTVVMHKKFWTFLECEPSIWIIVAFSNNSEAILAAKSNANHLTSDQVISADALKSFLTRFYHLYYTMNGSIQSFLDANSQKAGMKIVDDIMLTQRKIRKIRKRIMIKESDIKKRAEDENAFVPESTESMEDLTKELSTTQRKLSELLCHPHYTLAFLKMKLSNFIQWYLSQENINHLSIFSSSSSPLTYDFSSQSRKLNFCMTSVMRLVKAVKHSCPEGLSIQCILSYENKLLWSDCNDFLTHHLLEFFYRLDQTIKIGSTNRKIRLATEEFTKSLFFQEARGDYAFFDQATKEKMVQALKRKEERLQSRYGLTLVNGLTLNLDTFVTVLFPQAVTTTTKESMPSMSVSTKIEPLSDESEMLNRILQGDGFNFDDRNVVYFPRVFSRSIGTAATDANQADNSQKDGYVGRLLNFSFGKFSLSCIIKDNKAFRSFKTSTIQQVLEQPQGIVSKRIKLSWIHDQVLGSSAPLATSSNDNSAPVDGKRSIGRKDINRIQLLLISYLIQKNFRQEMERIEGNDWNKYFIPYTGTAYTPKMFQSILVNSQNSGTTSSSSTVGPNSSQPSASSTGGGVGGGSTSAGGSAGGNNNSNAAGGNNVYVNPTTIRALVTPKPFPERDCKAFYFTGNLAGLKILSKDTENNYPLFLQPDTVNDLRALLASSGSSGNLAALNSSSSTKNLETVLDQYFYNQNHHGPFAAIFYQCLVYSFGLSAMKALHDLWHELDSSIIEASPAFPVGDTPRFLCTRISVAGRGGVWVLGRQFLHGQPLFLLVSGCSILQEVFDVLDNVLREIKRLS